MGFPLPDMLNLFANEFGVCKYGLLDRMEIVGGAVDHLQRRRGWAEHCTYIDERPCRPVAKMDDRR